MIYSTILTGPTSDRAPHSCINLPVRCLAMCTAKSSLRRADNRGRRVLRHRRHHARSRRRRHQRYVPTVQDLVRAAVLEVRRVGARRLAPKPLDVLHPYGGCLRRQMYIWSSRSRAVVYIIKKGSCQKETQTGRRLSRSGELVSRQAQHVPQAEPQGGHVKL